MIVTVLWEDQRGVQAKGFGPHELLLSCLVDRCADSSNQADRSRLHEKLRRHVLSVPKKGNGNVLRELTGRLQKLSKGGPIVAVLDRDRIADLWRGRKDVRVPDGMCHHKVQIKNDAPGDYEVIFLVENVETLTTALLQARGPARSGKPTPDERDRILGGATWGDPQRRKGLLEQVPSFARLVSKVAERISPAFTAIPPSV